MSLVPRNSLHNEIANKLRLAEHVDVAKTKPADGEVYAWDATNALFKPTGVVDLTSSGVITGITGAFADGVIVNAGVAGTQLWQRVGDVVHVQGTLILSTNIAGSNGSIELPLPVASNFTQTTDASGLISPGRTGSDLLTGGISASVANNSLVLQIAVNKNISMPIYYSCMYLVKTVIDDE